MSTKFDLDLDTELSAEMTVLVECVGAVEVMNEERIETGEDENKWQMARRATENLPSWSTPGRHW